MKKLLFPALLLVLSLTACDSENEFHQTSFDRTNIVMYADQQRDSVLLYYADDWTATLSDASWLTLLKVEQDAEGNIISQTPVTTLSDVMPEDALLMSQPIFVGADANTTGRIRYTKIQVQSHENAEIVVNQLPLLNITYPYYSYKEGTELNKDNIAFIGSYKADATAGEVVFTVYRDDATLTTNQEWCTPDATTFEAGKHTVALELQPNTTGESRTATLTLTSGGVTSDITIVQSNEKSE